MAKQETKKDTETKGPTQRQVVIKPPNLKVLALRIRGTSPYVQHAFANKAKIMETQEAGSTARKGRKREPKDFDRCYRDAMHVAKDGWLGIPAASFRCACISACRVVGFQMTRAKLSVFCLADGFDERDGTPLVKITKGEPRRVDHPVRNDNGSVDIRARPMWDDGWEAVVRFRYDADQFQPDDVVNLLLAAGMQVGIGEGRPDSKNSAGMGWGTFEVVGGSNG